MTDEVDITSGGAVAVDTASLDHASCGFRAVADELSSLADRASAAAALLDAAATTSGWDGAGRAREIAAALAASAATAEHLAHSLGQAARVYEIVELTAERDLARAAGDDARTRAAEARLAAARGAEPGAAVLADVTMAQWRLRWGADTVGAVGAPLGWLDPVGGFALGLVGAGALVLGGSGLVPRSARTAGPRPAGPRPPVEIARVDSGGTRSGGRICGIPAPSALQTLVARIPSGGTADPARIRVERFTMPDGSREFAVYLAGTQSPAAGDGETWDMLSNLQLYGGADAASLEAARAALADAGAEPGDPLTITGFSQGAMVGAWLAQDGEYDVRALVVAGSPVVPDLPDVPVVALEHVDDPIAALGGPHGAGMTGSDDSLLVRRTVDPFPGSQDILIPAHRQDAYVETARLADESGDPRLADLDGLWERLGSATDVEAIEYAARRPG